MLIKEYLRDISSKRYNLEAVIENGNRQRLNLTEKAPRSLSARLWKDYCFWHQPPVKFDHVDRAVGLLRCPSRDDGGAV